MSKVDALRALREARYAAQTTPVTPPGKAGASTQGPPAARSRQAAPPARRAVAPEAVSEAGAELCGHRNMSGRSCTRPTAHAEKNHRYS